MSGVTTWVRRALPAVLALFTAATLLSVSSDSTDARPADLLLAADTSQFDPGNIISDAMFFDAGGMSAAQVSSFVNAKGANCRASSGGTPCLKDFRQNTFTRPADSICRGSYTGAPGEWAPQIIWKVAQACRINPKVLLVLLQKEQGLVTASGTYLTARRYQIAAGMGCPDTAACDTQYYGFYNQVYSAARQYQRYATFPRNYSYRAGATNTIQWDVETSCGTSQVYIRNQATAGLYNYTPYRPNAAALRAGYGTGDGCSAYGNRNFWLYFTDWFGSTQSAGGDAILAAYDSRGGAGGPLGPSTGPVTCGLVFGGCLQNYQAGTLYWSPASGAHAVSHGPIGDAWGAQRWEQSLLGYPIADQRCGLKDGGCLQRFQGGTIYTTSATGTRTLLNGPIANAWEAQRWEQGPLGYPTADQRCGLKDGGCSQTFQGGAIYTTSATGTRTLLNGPIATAWEAQSAEQGPLGYPTGNQRCGLKDGGCLQQFRGGTIYTTSATGTRTIRSGPIADAWGAQGWEQGALGYPTADQRCGLKDGGCSQTFQGGSIVWSKATGAHALAGAVRTAWTAQGAETGPLGYPQGGRICGLVRGGCLQQFQGGTIYTTSATGTRILLNGPIATAWGAQRWERGPLGYPTSDAYAVANGTAQKFEGGRLVLNQATGKVSRG